MERIQQYKLIIESFLDSPKQKIIQKDSLRKDLYEFATILHHFMNGAPADHFQVNLITGEVTDMIDKL